MFRSDFPVFSTYPDLIYLDSASTAQKPFGVIEGISDMMQSAYANIHRGSYDLSEKAEAYYEASKEKLAQFLGASSRHEIVYTYNATYAFNYLARSLVKSGYLKSGDHVLLTLLEHHANIVPWQILAEEYGIIIDWVDVTIDGRIDMDDLERKIHGVKLLSITGASNVTGAITNLAKVRDMINAEQDRPIFVVDGSQLLPHVSIDVTTLDIDFLIATGHKIMSDTGIGFLYGKKHLLKSLVPAFSGGGAINHVRIDGYESAGLPTRHEPGTPHILGARSLLAALEYIESIGGYPAIEAYERDLVEYTLAKIEKLPDSIRLLGPSTSEQRLGVFSFFFDSYHPRDVADALADLGIAVRAGHHCAEPLHEHFSIPASLRMSLYLYNTRSDIDHFFTALTPFMTPLG